MEWNDGIIYDTFYLAIDWYRNTSRCSVCKDKTKISCCWNQSIFIWRLSLVFKLSCWNVMTKSHEKKSLFWMQTFIIDFWHDSVTKSHQTKELVNIFIVPTNIIQEFSVKELKVWIIHWICREIHPSANLSDWKHCLKSLNLSNCERTLDCIENLKLEMSPMIIPSIVTCF